MDKSKTGFRPNPDQSRHKPGADKSKSARQVRRERNRAWKRNKTEPLKPAVVNPRKERIRKTLWILKWVVLIPLTIYALWWFSIILQDLIPYVSG
jgi:hypothetical protein